MGDKAAPQPSELPFYRSFTYAQAGGRPLRLHVRPADALPDARPRPAVVFFFGGGWLYGSITQFAPQAEMLARHGFAVVLADYRVKCRDGTSPDTAMRDAAAAFEYVRRNAASLGIDPGAIVAAGGSAGGQLALSLAFNRTLRTRPRALLLYNPVLDLDAEPFPANFPALSAAQLQQASPFDHRDIAYPPMLIMHGTVDQLVPARQVETFCRTVARRGSCCLLLYPGATHGFFNRSVAGGRWFAATTEAALAFLDRTLPSPRLTKGERARD